MVPWTWWSHEATRNFSSSSCTLSTVAIFVARLTYFKKKKKKKKNYIQKPIKQVPAQLLLNKQAPSKIHKEKN
jgi:hypothetical protein